MWDKIVKIAQSGRPRIAIGLSCVNPEIEEILKQASKFADMVVMGQDVAGYQSEPKATAHEAVKALKTGCIDGFVLGGFSEPEEDDCNLIVTPSGHASNLIGTTLYLAGYYYTGGPALFDQVYVHTSGTLQEKTYLDSIIFATALANLRK
jgi:hypothetical protein